MTLRDFLQLLAGDELLDFIHALLARDDEDFIDLLGSR